MGFCLLFFYRKDSKELGESVSSVESMEYFLPLSPFNVNSGTLI